MSSRALRSVESRDTEILFEIGEDALLVANGGRPFTREGVISVCASHLSEKRSYKPIDDFDVTIGDLVAQIRARELATYRNDHNRITSDFSAEEETRRDYGGRFLWELLQNADDAMGRETRTSADLIGSKGLGFKAILEIGDEPELHSKDFHFRFSVSDTRVFLLSNEVSKNPPPLTFRIPHDCPPNEEVCRLVNAGYATVALARMHRFGKHYAREVFVQYLAL